MKQLLNFRYVCVCVCVYTYTHTPTTRDISKNEVIKSYHRLESLYFFFWNHCTFYNYHFEILFSIDPMPKEKK